MHAPETKFQSTILILPGLGGSGEDHWQTLWEKKYPEFIRIEQDEWNTPDMKAWVNALQKSIQAINSLNIILVAHSAACAVVAKWASQFNHKIKGALLVAPADTESESFPKGPTGFSPMPLQTLPFKSIVVLSRNDFYVTVDRAKLFANQWGSDTFDMGQAGHINASSGVGLWQEGLDLLLKLDQT